MRIEDETHTAVRTLSFVWNEKCESSCRTYFLENKSNKRFSNALSSQNISNFLQKEKDTFLWIIWNLIFVEKVVFSLFCRSRWELSKKTLIATFSVDTAESEPSKIWSAFLPWTGSTNQLCCGSPNSSSTAETWAMPVGATDNWQTRWTEPKKNMSRKKTMFSTRLSDRWSLILARWQKAECSIWLN